VGLLKANWHTLRSFRLERGLLMYVCWSTVCPMAYQHHWHSQAEGKSWMIGPTPKTVKVASDP
jgi:hypothetical protein